MKLKARRLPYSFLQTGLDPFAEEMGAQLQRTAFSVNVKERLDFSCALVDADGELLVNAQHIPVHLGSMGICTPTCEGLY